LTSAEKAELDAARRRIHELETEVAIHRRATECLKGESSPKGGLKPTESAGDPIPWEDGVYGKTEQVCAGGSGAGCSDGVRA
jgi:hypothetical protein